MNDLLAKQKDWTETVFTDVSAQWIQSIILLLLVLILRNLVTRASNKLGNTLKLDARRKKVTQRVLNYFTLLIVIILLAGVWGLDRKDLFFFVSSVITVIGVAFFAQWSILSNVTAGIIIFFNYPIQIGQIIRIYDKDFDVTGELIDISTFFMKVRNDEGKVFTIPNNIVLQKMIAVE